ncbi:uncharacterized protein [Paramisgurnus dabryanus]|uniref:uncharacterized protein n=1 Tax=Paramisgurnus dabryanus TaxID=90735 RepID=UPI003CCF9C28
MDTRGVPLWVAPAHPWLRPFRDPNLVRTSSRCLSSIYKPRPSPHLFSSHTSHTPPSTLFTTFKPTALLTAITCKSSPTHSLTHSLTLQLTQGAFHSTVSRPSTIKRLAYPLYVIDALLQRCEKKNIHLRVVCYIACVVASHLQKSGEGISHNIALAVPEFHVYGHKLPRQIKYSTRWLDGFGLTDGEGMKRLWSFLQRFARVTKEMTPSHRLDLLTDVRLDGGNQLT